MLLLDLLSALHDTDSKFEQTFRLDPTKQGERDLTLLRMSVIDKLRKFLDYSVKFPEGDEEAEVEIRLNQAIDVAAGDPSKIETLAKDLRSGAFYNPAQEET